MVAITQKDNDELARAISHELAKLFTNITIEKVFVSPETDRDGNDVLRVEVVFSGALLDVDAKNVAGAARQIMPTIDGLVDDDDLYPLLSFVSKLDYERRGRGASY